MLSGLCEATEQKTLWLGMVLQSSAPQERVLQELAHLDWVHCSHGSQPRTAVLGSGSHQQSNCTPEHCSIVRRAFATNPGGSLGSSRVVGHPLHLVTLAECADHRSRAGRKIAADNLPSPNARLFDRGLAVSATRGAPQAGSAAGRYGRWCAPGAAGAGQLHQGAQTIKQR